jgi:osmotically-inducible protein OsmY
MKILPVFIILGCFAFSNSFAYISTNPEEPKMYHNKPGESATSDDDIKNKIRSILNSEWLPYDISEVAYTVNEGNVTLTGSVETLSNKKKLEDQIKRIDGVNQIDNRLEIVKKKD